MAFLEELKQRKVVRVAVAYLVAAWLIVQVASIALPAFAAPAWTLRVLILLVALGFPLALLLAWALDLTPEGPRFVPGGTGWKRLLVACAVIGLLAIGWFVSGSKAVRPEAASSPRPAAAALVASDPRSIAVLPFVNMSGDPKNEYFSDGLAETTLDTLAKVRDLKVIARTSSFAFKGKAEDVRAIGRALNAAHVLEGSVQQSGDTVRITVQLIRASDGMHLWSNKYDRKLSDVFAIQDEIANEVLKALQLVLPAEQQKRLVLHGTKDVAAYQEYLRGTALLAKRKVPDMRAAHEHFKAAIARDPNYAAAYAQAAISLGLLQNYGGSLDEKDRTRQRDYAATAMRLDPGLGEANIALGMVREQDLDLDAAGESYRRGVELAPSYASGLQWYGEYLLNDMGDLEHSLPLFARSVEVDPLSPQVSNQYVQALAASGRLQEARALIEDLLRRHPDFAAGYATRGGLLEVEGDLVGSLRAFREMERVDPDALNRRVYTCSTMLRFGALAEARRCLEKREREGLPAQRTEPLRSAIAFDSGDTAGALAAARKIGKLDPWGLQHHLINNGDYAGALAIWRKLDPGMLMQPEPKLTSKFSVDALDAGIALIGSGAREQGRHLLQVGMRANSSLPVRGMMFARGWTDAIAWAALEDVPKSCAALREAVAADYYENLATLDHDPTMAKVRADACYTAALAPARAKAAAQVEAARKQGLLD